MIEIEKKLTLWLYHRWVSVSFVHWIIKSFHYFQSAFGYFIEIFILKQTKIIDSLSFSSSFCFFLFVSYVCMFINSYHDNWFFFLYFLSHIVRDDNFHHLMIIAHHHNDDNKKKILTMMIKWTFAKTKNNFVPIIANNKIETKQNKTKTFLSCGICDQNLPLNVYVWMSVFLKLFVDFFPFSLSLQLIVQN